MERLSQETRRPDADLTVNWEAKGEIRPSSRANGTEPDVWLHVQAHALLPLTCQRCMAAMTAPLSVDQWYRFVATEDIAMAEDDQSEEDLLVLEPQFDLLAVIEDELLMALPLVPMHAVCPTAPLMSAGDLDIADDAPDKPNPFAVLAQLKTK